MKKVFTLLSVVLLSNSLFSQTGAQAFTASGMFTVPAGVTSITIQVVGGGGSGGGNGTGGGGGGGFSMGVYSVTPLSTFPVTIGTAGGTTSVGALIQATGGGQGVSVPNPQIGGGGAGGVGSGGTVNFTGGIGGGGFYTYFGGGGGGAAGSTGNGGIGGNTIAWTGICQTPGGSAGIAGGAPGGDGGKGAGFTDVNCNITNPSAGGVNYGGGGGGGNGNGGGPGVGANGYALITWLTTGISTVVSNDNVLLVQNPFTDKIILNNANGNENFELMNSVGQLIWAGKNIEQNDFSGLIGGMYILKVQSQNSSQNIRLIKQ
ncbi:MAG: T9SS type A sorting domain-containing protein [Bacteroidetes bacterium]|nr:T9SS type A sorting domain-containing protein [Bacteroidota bacterium]